MGTGGLLYLVSTFLIVNYIRKRASGFASKDEIAPGIQAWELTAGTGVVPKWVSFIGILSIAFLMASPFELIASFFRWIF